MLRDVRRKLFYKGNDVMVALSRCIDVAPKKQDVIPAYKRHDTLVIKAITGSLCPCIIASCVGVLALFERSFRGTCE
jgi:hypothetical protein